MELVQGRTGVRWSGTSRGRCRGLHVSPRRGQRRLKHDETQLCVVTLGIESADDRLFAILGVKHQVLLPHLIRPQLPGNSFEKFSCSGKPYHVAAAVRARAHAEASVE